jgi:hypothetical protein
LNRARDDIDTHARLNDPVEEQARAARLDRALSLLVDPDRSPSGPFDRTAIRGGEVLDPDDLPAYVRDVTRPANGKSDLPRFSFDLGPQQGQTVERLATVNTAIAGAARQRVTISNQVVDKLYRNNPGEADHLLASLPRLLAEGDAFSDRDAPGRALLVRDYETTRGSQKNGVVVMEVARSEDGAEIVSVHVMLDRTLKKLKEDSGAGGTASPHTAGPKGTPAAAVSQGEFPTVGTAPANISGSGGGFNPAGAAATDTRQLKLKKTGLEFSAPCRPRAGSCRPKAWPAVAPWPILPRRRTVTRATRLRRRVRRSAASPVR